MRCSVACIVLSFGNPAQIGQAAIAHNDYVVPAFPFRRHQRQQMLAGMNKLIGNPQVNRDLAECAGISLVIGGTG